MVTAYCINLDRRPDRWDRMQDVAAAAGLALHRIAAIDGLDAASAADRARLPDRGPTGALGQGAKACTLSHARAWEAVVASGEAWGLVLEDDVVLSRDAGAVMAALLANPPEGLDVVKLEAGGSVRVGILVGPEMRMLAGRSLRRCHQIATDSAAYAISARGAAQALARVGECDVGVDHFLFYPRARIGAAGLAFGLVVPPVARQDRKIGSDIAPQRYGARDRLQRLRRAAYEAAQAPGMIAALLRGARVIKAPFRD